MIVKPELHIICHMSYVICVWKQILYTNIARVYYIFLTKNHRKDNSAIIVFMFWFD